MTDIDSYWPVGIVQVRDRPWPGVDGKCIEYEFSHTESKLGHDPVRVLRGEPGKSISHATWRDGHYRSVEDVEAMADLLITAARLMREIEDD